MEKMLANGYTDLVDAPDHNKGVVCPFPEDKWGSWSCYRQEAAGSGPELVLISHCSWCKAEGSVVQEAEDGEAEFWSFTGKPEQVWVWSESGEQLINRGSGEALGVGGFREWRVNQTAQGQDQLVTTYGGKVGTEYA